MTTKTSLMQIEASLLGIKVCIHNQNDGMKSYQSQYEIIFSRVYDSYEHPYQLIMIVLDVCEIPSYHCLIIKMCTNNLLCLVNVHQFQIKVYKYLLLFRSDHRDIVANEEPKSGILNRYKSPRRRKRIWKKN